MKLDEAERAQRVDNFVLGLIDWPGEAAVLASIFDPLWKESYAKGAEVASRVYGLPGYSEAGVGVYRQAEGRHQGEEYHGNHPEGNRPYCLLWPGARGQQGHDCLPNPGGDADHQRTGPDLASQECNCSLISGNHDMMRRAGAKWKIWHVREMSVARDSHKKLNGKRVPIDGYFEPKPGVRLSRPCDPDCSDASEVVNCHCTLTYEWD